MLKKVFIVSFIVTVLSLQVLPGQQKYHTRSSRALKAYVDAKEQYDFLFYDNAEKLLREAISVDGSFYEAHLLLGELLAARGKHAEAAGCFRKAVAIDSLYYKPLFLSLASSEMQSGDYERALIHYNVYLALKTGNEKNAAAARRNIINCEFAIEAMKNPVSFSPQSLGDQVNTSHDEYWPSITADGQTLMFTRQEVIRSTGRKGHEDFFISRLKDNAWQTAENAGAPLNTPQNEGAQSISSDGTYMYFTACDKREGLGRCDIWYSSFDGSRWSEARNPGSPVNTAFWESQPSISSNGRMLFFTSNRPGGEGGMDIWFSVAGSDNKWKEPRNAGSQINTSGDEMSPFIHFDGRTLYFSSNGRAGMGGFDIYFSRMNEDTTFTAAKNIGYPINTISDELGLIIDAEGVNAYFSTTRVPGKGKDIFFFNLYEAARPDPVSYFRGRVFDSETMKPVSPDYELINLSNGSVVASGSSDAGGSFLVCLPSGFNYGLNVNLKGYLFYSDNFMFEGIHTAAEPYNKRILLNPVRVGESLQLTNVFFEIDSWEIKRESDAELTRLARLLKDNPAFIVEVAGYTDSTGSDAHNLTLSERRAGSVLKWLTVNGIDKDRLTAKGYGSSSPVGDNITNEGRRLNRRTEIRITGTKK